MRMEIIFDEFDRRDGSRAITVTVKRDDVPVFRATEWGIKERFSRFTNIKALFYKMQDEGVFADEAPF